MNWALAEAGSLARRAGLRTAGASSQADLLRRVAERLGRESGWDQQTFNQEAFLLSHSSYNGSKVSVRVMDYMLFANSKALSSSPPASPLHLR